MYVNIYDQYFWRKSFWRKDKKFAQVYFKMQKERWKKKNIWGKSFSQAFSKIPRKIFYQLLPLAYKWHNKYPLYISQRWRDQIQLCKILQHFKIELGTAPAFHTQIADTRLLRGNESWW